MTRHPARRSRSIDVIVDGHPWLGLCPSAAGG
jgi:hypothetical protein